MKFVLGRLIPCVNHFIQHAEVTSERTNLSPFTKDYRGEASRMRFNILSDSEQENIIQLRWSIPKPTFTNVFEKAF